MSPHNDLRLAARGRLILAGRTLLSSGHPLSSTIVTDVCSQAGVNRRSFPVFFKSEGDYLDAINAEIVEDCAQRLAAGVRAFRPDEQSRDDGFVQAARALAQSRPLERGGVLIRAERRVRALRGGREADLVAAAERSFVGAVVDILVDLMSRLDRVFTWPAKLAVRVILDTYERSFELWLLSGHDDSDFASSPYATRTLPELLQQMSVACPRIYPSE